MPTYDECNCEANIWLRYVFSTVIKCIHTRPIYVHSMIWALTLNICMSEISHIIFCSCQVQMLEIFLYSSLLLDSTWTSNWSYLYEIPKNGILELSPQHNWYFTCENVTKWNSSVKMRPYVSIEWRVYRLFTESFEWWRYIPLLRKLWNQWESTMRIEYSDIEYT